MKRGRGGGDVWIAAWLVGVVDSGDENAACPVFFSFVFPLPWSTALLSDGDGGRPKSGAAFQKELLVSSLP